MEGHSHEMTEPFEEVFIPENHIILETEEHQVDCSPQHQSSDDTITSRNIQVPENNSFKHLQCAVCDIDHAHPELLAWHSKYCHGDYTIVNALKYGDNPPIYQCVICKKDYQDLGCSIQHLFVQHKFTDLPFHCDFCSRCFISKTNLSKHLKICKKTRTECNVLVGYGDLSGPSIIGTPQSSPDCIKNCDKSQVQPLTPKRPCKNVKTSIENHKCNDCGLTYIHVEMLTWHIKYCHGINAIAKCVGNTKSHFYQCNRCVNMYRDIRLLILHLRELHEFSDLPYKCDTCNVSFICKRSLAVHRRKCMCDGNSYLKCDQCGIYADPEMLAWHSENCHGNGAIIKVKINGKLHSYHCVLCANEYKEFFHIISHLRSGHKLLNLPSQCSGCNKFFTKLSSLENHQLRCKNVDSVQQIYIDPSMDNVPVEENLTSVTDDNCDYVFIVNVNGDQFNPH